ncbi:MAG: hypothetical protein H6811_05345 [Phycisphaeraceae bacterium]|nr:hypothetical protein [Phycisphaeraceae bacterium]
MNLTTSALVACLAAPLAPAQPTIHDLGPFTLAVDETKWAPYDQEALAALRQQIAQVGADDKVNIIAGWELIDPPGEAFIMVQVTDTPSFPASEAESKLNQLGNAMAKSSVQASATDTSKKLGVQATLGEATVETATMRLTFCNEYAAPPPGGTVRQRIIGHLGKGKLIAIQYNCEKSKFDELDPGFWTFDEGFAWKPDMALQVKNPTTGFKKPVLPAKVPWGLIAAGIGLVAVLIFGLGKKKKPAAA